MPALEISRSMLVNQGLSAHPELARFAVNEDGITPASDIVATFKRIVIDDALSVADRDLVATVTAFTSPLELATYFINAKYTELGGPGGRLGATVSAVSPAASGFVRTFQHGAIYFHPQVGAHALHGPVRARWQELGGETGFLGFPTSDVTPGSDVRAEGVFAHFQGGSIYWAPPTPQPGMVAGTVAGTLAGTLIAGTAIRPAATAAASAVAQPARPAGTTLTSVVSGTRIPGSVVDTVGVTLVREPAVSSAGAFEVHGAIRQKYLALGAEASILGYPRTDETATPDGVGRFNHFQGGSIYWTPGTSAHEVHGLIRDRWASQGWERNPQLGYPITDELIPDRRVGHRRPEVRKKPIVAMPSDMIKLPADAAAAGFPSTVVNTPTVAAAAMTPAPAVTRPAVTTRIAADRPGALGRLSERTGSAAIAADSAVIQPAVTMLDPGLLVPIVAGPASTAADVRSVNRFADFESGVLFWQRGATSASTVSPIAATSDGTAMSFSGADVAAAAMAKIGRTTFEGANVRLGSVSVIGTTGYSFDGAQTHNRRHRLQLILQGIENSGGPFGIPVPTPVTATVELHVEVWFDAAQRRIALTPVDWHRTQASTSSYGADVDAVLRARVDPILWTNHELTMLPDTDGGAPIAVLSVKTLANGTVAVFVEPRSNLLLGSITELANAVTPSTVLLQPK